MRHQFALITTGLALLTGAFASSVAAQAPSPTQPSLVPVQTPLTPTQPLQAVEPTLPAGEAPALGSFDLGYRGTDYSGDAARLERYRDLRDGSYARILFDKRTDQYLFDARALNIGYRDQSYRASYIGEKAQFKAFFDSTPLNYGYNTSTPWVEQQTAVLMLDPAARTAVQNKLVVGVPQNITDLQTPSIYRGLANPLELTQLRQTGGFSLLYDRSPTVGFDAAYNISNKSGHQPYGASFAFNVANEVPLALDNHTNDVNLGVEFTRPKGMLRFGWNGNWFSNNVHQLVWDNAYRATDTNPYDPSGYSNGNGPAQGRLATPPSNSLNAFSAIGVYKLPRNSTLNGSITFTKMNQDDALIPWTINPVINQPSVFAQFPNLAALPRGTAEAKVDGVNGILNFNSRVNRYVNFTARYRYNDHTNNTTPFDGTQYVRFDAVPENTGKITEQFDITENLFDAAATFTVIPYTALRVSYGYDSFNRTGRSFNNMTDNAFRVSIDMLGREWITVRGQYEYVGRTGSGFSQDALEDGGFQPGLRFYDEADRTRNDGSLVVTINPRPKFDISFSLATGKDTYSGPGHEFGLLGTDNTAINVGLNFYPSDAVNFGFNYGHDHYNTNQSARNANPPPDPTFTDPTRDWSLNNAENVNNFDLYLDLPKLLEKTNIRFSYNFSDSGNAFLFGGPRIDSLTAAGQFIPLPDVTNSWNRLTADIQYFFRPKVGVGFSYWFENYHAVDFATIDLPGQPGTPRIDYLGVISTGYGNRPYTGNTAFLRLLYFF
jgi:MtrB/PioB family decaheme-associated outer membrane protein